LASDNTAVGPVPDIPVFLLFAPPSPSAAAFFRFGSCSPPDQVETGSLRSQAVRSTSATDALEERPATRLALARVAIRRIVRSGGAPPPLTQSTKLSGKAGKSLAAKTAELGDFG
jgi:hypothetical protein